MDMISLWTQTSWSFEKTIEMWAKRSVEVKVSPLTRVVTPFPVSPIMLVTVGTSLTNILSGMSLCLVRNCLGLLPIIIKGIWTKIKVLSWWKIQLNMLDCPGVQLKGRPPLLSSCMILCILIFPALPMRMLLRYLRRIFLAFKIFLKLRKWSFSSKTLFSLTRLFLCSPWLLLVGGHFGHG